MQLGKQTRSELEAVYLDLLARWNLLESERQRLAAEARQLADQIKSAADIFPFLQDAGPPPETIRVTSEPRDLPSSRKEALPLRKAIVCVLKASPGGAPLRPRHVAYAIRRERLVGNLGETKTPLGARVGNELHRMAKLGIVRRLRTGYRPIETEGVCP